MNNVGFVNMNEKIKIEELVEMCDKVERKEKVEKSKKLDIKKIMNINERMKMCKELESYEMIYGDGEGYIIKEINRNESVDLLMELFMLSMYGIRDLNEYLENCEDDKLYLCLNVMDGVRLDLMFESELIINR